MSTLAITYRKNPLYSSETPAEPRLFAKIDLSRYGVDVTITDLPIFFRQLDQSAGPIRVVYSTRVAGIPLERGNLQGIVTVLDRYLGALIRFERLPEYVFHVGTSAWPIYRLPDQLVTRYPGGPVFSAPSIAELQHSLADHFKQVGRIESREALGILYFSPADLQLYQPACTLRSPDTADIPVFPSQNGHGKKLLAPVDSQSIAVTLNGGAEILDLHREVSAYLVERGRLADPHNLTVCELAAGTWERTRATLTPHTQALSYYQSTDGRMLRHHVPVFANGDTLVAAWESQSGRTSLYLGSDVRALQSRLGQHLYTRGEISSPDVVQPVAAAGRPGPGSRLDSLLSTPTVLATR